MNNYGNQLSTEPDSYQTSNNKFDEDPNVNELHGDRRWASDDVNFWTCSSTFNEIPAGLYKPRSSQQLGFYLEKQIVDTDDLIHLPDTASKRVIDEINEFWSLKEEFTKRGYIHKRGVLMWGDPGSGKTSTVQLMTQTIIKEGGIALFAGNPVETTSCLQMIRRIEPNRRIIVIMEDFESMIREYGDSEYLAMLDGESQVSDVVFVATTNYPEKLDKRFIDRPSRFDTVIKVGMPSEDARRNYLKHKEPSLKDDELELWVSKTDGMSIAHLKEIIISCKCYNKPLDDVIKRLAKMRKREISSDNALHEKEKMVGFTANAA